MYKILIISTFLAVAFIFSSANVLVAGQNSEAEKEQGIHSSQHAFGFGAGITTGYGLSYRYFENRFGIHANFAPFYTERRYHLSTGLSILFKIESTEYVNFYLYQGNHLLTEYYKKTQKHTYRWFNGLGVCIEIIMRERASFNIMGGFGGRDNFDEIGFTGELALYFLF